MTPEPVAVINTITAFVEAVLALGAGFGAFGNVDGKQIGLIMAVVVTLGNVLKTLWARKRVTPVAAPRDAQGNHLVPAKEAAARAAAA